MDVKAAKGPRAEVYLSLAPKTLSPVLIAPHFLGPRPSFMSPATVPGWGCCTACKTVPAEASGLEWGRAWLVSHSCPYQLQQPSCGDPFHLPGFPNTYRQPPIPILTSLAVGELHPNLQDWQVPALWSPLPLRHQSQCEVQALTLFPAPQPPGSVTSFPAHSFP